MDYKAVLGILATGIALFGYIPYFRDILANRTKPHAFSWLVWGTLTAISFFGQLAGGAGPGAWVMGFTAVVCFMIFFFGLVKGNKNIVTADWISFAGAGIAMILWVVTQGPLLSVVLVTITDALGFVPTFRKSYAKPHEETLVTYALSGFKMIIAFFALENISVVTALYPAYLIFANFAFVAMLLVRRNQLGHRKE